MGGVVFYGRLCSALQDVLLVVARTGLSWSKALDMLI